MHIVDANLLLTSLDALPVRKATYGASLGPILLDDVVCTGTEPSLLMCERNPIREHDCDHTEDAGVICEGRYWVLMVSAPKQLCRVIS